MMPVIRISDATFADLKAVATWLETDTPSLTIEKLVAEKMVTLDLERDLPEALDQGETDADTPLEFKRTPGLSFTRVIGARVNGIGLPVKNWAGLMIELAAKVRATGKTAQEMVTELGVPSHIGRYEDQGYKYYDQLGVSIQGQSAPDAWREIERIARKWSWSIEVDFEWRDNPKAAHPGRRGILRSHH